ncbi:MAG: hypothetical protein JHD02_06750 [Thermoleophilaceae bacterium]|nr:hypothetical protein [Thermoleophilaceae bacterium]
MIAVSGGRHDGMRFAISFAVNAAATWLGMVLLIGLGESWADNRLNNPELGEKLDLLSTIFLVIGALTVPAVTAAWCLIVKTGWKVAVVATASSIACYFLGTIAIYRIWESLQARIAG